MIPKTYFLPEYFLEPVLNKKEFYRFETITTNLLDENYSEEKTLIREVRFTYLGKKKELFVFELFTNKVELLFNQKIRNEKLSKEGIYAFDEIDLGVTTKGDIVEVYNLEAMKKRWERKKAELRKDNSGSEFEIFLDDISNILEDEEKVIFFLNSKNMFGLYFHGLFGKYDIKETPIKRTAKILGLNDVTINEEIYIDNEIPGFKITAQKSINQDKKIISTNDEIKKYDGQLIYNEENLLKEGFLEIENENRNIKYSVIWVG